MIYLLGRNLLKFYVTEKVRIKAYKLTLKCYSDYIESMDKWCYRLINAKSNKWVALFVL